MRTTLYILTIAAGLMIITPQALAQGFTFVFYNVENLFDVKDDPLTADEEFTPGGTKKWDHSRYHEKLDNIARVLTGIGEWELPAIVGLCEVENKNVLYDLTAHRLLKEADYHIIHKDSPDRRGIDVGLIYRGDIFSPINSSWIKIYFEEDTSLTTRDILYVKGIVNALDTLHIFINHWPSRWGGVEASMPKRVAVARQLRSIVDSLFTTDDHINIIIAGDFNDSPSDSSMFKVLEAKDKFTTDRTDLLNLMYTMNLQPGFGTLKYRENWEIYDQIIISTAVKELEQSELLLNGPYIYDPKFLLSKDERYLGYKPFRTYSGPRYLGGFSDHLPVYIQYKTYSSEKGQ